METKCTDITKSGERCSIDALEGSDYCGIHKKKHDAEITIQESIAEIKSDKLYMDIQVHWINRQGTFGVEGSWPKETIRNYVQQMRNAGYKLFNTHYAGSNPEAYGLVMIFVLDD